MKILNLYAGIGGNRKLWGNDHEITAVELNPEIAEIYRDYFPNDTVIVGDAHQYLLNHFKEFDFIWSSPPCQSNSRARFWGHGKTLPVYPDLKLYQEWLLLSHYYGSNMFEFKSKFVIENVIPYYKPIIKPTLKLGRHLFWSNFQILPFNSNDADIKNGNLKEWQDLHGFNISGYKLKDRKDQILRNCVQPEVGLHILNESQRNGLF